MLKGDGFDLPVSYSNTKYYLKANEIFSEVVEKIEDKKSLLFVFVERHRIDALALSRSIGSDEIVQLFGNFKSEFKNTTNEQIQAQVAYAMMNEVFDIWKINEDNITDEILQNEMNTYDEIINNFSLSNNPAMQEVVAKCLKSKANILSKEFETNQKKKMEMYEKIIGQFGDSGDDRLKMQVSKALLNKIYSLKQLNEMEKIKNKWNRNRKNYDLDILDTSLELIKKFKGSDIPVVQEDVILTMSELARIKNEEGSTSEAMEIYKEILGEYKSNNRDEVIFWVANTILDKGYMLENLSYDKNSDQKNLYMAKETYEELLEPKFLNYGTKRKFYTEIQIIIATAMNQIAGILLRQNELDNALAMIEKVINNYPLYKDELINIYAFKIKVEILIRQADKNQDDEKIGEAMNICSLAFSQFMDSDFECQNILAEILMTMAINKNNLGNYKDAIDILAIIINKYSENEYQRHAVFKQIVKDAMVKKMQMENTIPIYEIFEFYQTNERNTGKLINSIMKNNVIPIIGAGLSAFAGYPIWKRFLEDVFDSQKPHFQDISKDNFKNMSCKDQASKLKETLGIIFEDEVKDRFADRKINEDEIKKQAIWFLPMLFKNQVILTTNFDNLIKLVFTLHKIISFDQCSRSNIDKIDSKTAMSTLLYKINGTIDSFKNIILTREGFDEAYAVGNDAYMGMQKVFRHEKDVLFLGCSLDEEHEILSFVKDQNISIFTIYPCKDDDTEKVETVNKLARNGVTSPILCSKKNGYSYLYDLLAYITSYCNKYKNDKNI